MYSSPKPSPKLRLAKPNPPSLLRKEGGNKNLAYNMFRMVVVIYYPVVYSGMILFLKVLL